MSEEYGMNPVKERRCEKAFFAYKRGEITLEELHNFLYREFGSYKKAVTWFAQTWSF